MNKKGTVEVEMKTKGFEDAAEDIEMIADAMDAFPSTINVKARDCEINIHNTNWIEQKQPPQKYAKGGLIASTGPEKIIQADGDQIRKALAKDISNMCSTTKCEDCIFSKDDYSCKITKMPSGWDL